MSGTKWCESCRSEFEPGITVCPDCQLPLVDKLPDTPPTAAAAPHTPSQPDPLFNAAVRARSNVARGSVVLQVVTAVAVVLWVVGALSTTWATWDQLAPDDTFGLESGNRFAILMTTVTANTWGYLIAAVLAYAAHLFLEHRQAESLIEALDEGGEW